MTTNTIETMKLPPLPPKTVTNSKQTKIEKINVDENEYKDWGYYKTHSHLSKQNVTNALIFLFVMTPSIYLVYLLNTNCECCDRDNWLQKKLFDSFDYLKFYQDGYNYGGVTLKDVQSQTCQLYIDSPLLFLR